MASGGNDAGTSSTSTSDDLTRIGDLLRETGVPEFEPSVPIMLLEATHSRAVRLLKLARQIAQHCGRTQIEESDVELAIKMSGTLEQRRVEQRRIQHETAERVNAQPLPAIRATTHGLRLPADKFCLFQQDVEWVGDPLAGARHGAEQSAGVQEMRPSQSAPHIRADQMRAALIRQPLAGESANTDFDAA